MLLPVLVTGTEKNQMLLLVLLTGTEKNSDVVASPGDSRRWRHVRGGESGRVVLAPQPPTEQVDAHLGVEAGVDDGVGGAVERGQALDEGADGHRFLALGDEPVHVQQVEHEVGAPEDHEHWRKEKGETELTAVLWTMDNE